MKKFWIRLFGWLSGCSEDSRGVGLGRGNLKHGRHDPEFWKWASGIKPKVAVATVVLAAAPASAGNFGDGGSVNGNGFDATASRFDRSTEMSPSMTQYDIYTRGIRERDNPNLDYGVVFNGIYDAAAAIGGWLGSGHQVPTGRVDYSAQGYGIGIGGFDPESRGSGVNAW